MNGVEHFAATLVERLAAGIATQRHLEHGLADLNWPYGESLPFTFHQRQRGTVRESAEDVIELAPFAATACDMRKVEPALKPRQRFCCGPWCKTVAKKRELCCCIGCVAHATPPCKLVD